MNVSLEESSNRVFGGGLSRDALGNWRTGFVANIRSCSINSGCRNMVHISWAQASQGAMIMRRNEVSINCRSIVQKICGLFQEFDAVTIHMCMKKGIILPIFCHNFL